MTARQGVGAQPLTGSLRGVPSETPTERGGADKALRGVQGRGMRSLGRAKVFEPSETVESPRLRLSRLRRENLEAMSSWLGDALAPDWRLADLEPVVEDGCAVLISDAAGEAVGAAVVRLDAPQPGTASVPFIAIDPARRFRGLGGEAGLALQRHLRRRGFGQVFAPVPDGHGLAVYFWLRLGYRPLPRAEVPWPLVGLAAESRPGIWLVRERE